MYNLPNMLLPNMLLLMLLLMLIMLLVFVSDNSVGQANSP